MSDERSVGIAQAALHQGPLSKDARTLLLYDANRKSAVIAYILWFFLGCVWRAQFLISDARVSASPRCCSPLA